MKKNTAILFVFIVFIFVLSLAGCGVPATNDSKEEQSTTISTVPQISSENVNQCAQFMVQNGKIYYQNFYDNGNLYSVNVDGSENRKLSDDWVSQFYVSDNQIFYDNVGRLYSMNIDGSGKHILSIDSLGTVFWNVSNGKIYYSSADDYKLYSMNTDGSDRKKLGNDEALYTTMLENRIYYFSRNTSERGICSIKTDGSDKIKLSDDNPFGLVAVNDWIYFANEGDDYKLYAMRTDGTDRHKLTDDYALSMNVADGRIYYRNINEGKSPIYSMNIDGSDKIKLSDDNVGQFAVWDGQIYYTMTGTNIYRMNLDGSNKQLIINLDREGYKDVSYEVKSRLNESMPEYRFVATGKTRMDEGFWGYIMGLNVFDENGVSILSADFSEINDDEVYGNPAYNEMMDTMGLHIVDVNFDGFKDVIILNSFGGAHSNTWYDCWLWDFETASFIKSESFGEICNPSLDPDKKCIYSTGGSGAAFWGGSIYQYINGKFVITNSLDTYENGLTETELVDGKMEVVRQVTYNNEPELLESEMEYYKNNELWQLDHARWYWVGGHDADVWLEE